MYVYLLIKIFLIYIYLLYSIVEISFKNCNSVTNLDYDVAELQLYNSLI